MKLKYFDKNKARVKGIGKKRRVKTESYKAGEKGAYLKSTLKN
jgi:hypothetical protein